MSVVLEQVLILFIFGAIGFILCKMNIIRSEHSTILSSLLVYVFLPCNIFKTYNASFSLSYITHKYKLILLSVCLTVFLIIVCSFTAKLFTQNSYERSIYEYSLIVPNYVYMGYALTESLFGNAGLINIMVFAIPVSLYIYTVGYCKLTKISLSAKKLLNPIIIATALGIISGLAGITFPETVNTVLDRASSCMGPVSMLLAGITVSQYSIRSLVTLKQCYIITLLRLVVIPVGIGLMLALFDVRRELIGISVMLFSLPCGMNTIIFPKLVDENCKIGASLAFISNILACVTVPVIYRIFVL